VYNSKSKFQPILFVSGDIPGRKGEKTMVQFKKEQKEKHMIEYEITIDGEKVRERLEDIYRKASQRVVIPGFRKGKAPRNILKTHLSKEFIHDELVQNLVPEALQQVVKEENLRILGEPDIELVNVSEDQPLIFKALILEKPQVMLANPEDIEVRKYHIEVRESDVDLEIEGIRKSKGVWMEKEDRPAETGDMVKVKTDNEEYAVIAGFSENDTPVSRAVVGFKKGETTKIRSEKIQEGSEPEEIEVSVIEVMKKEIPELNEEFLNQLGGEYQSIDDFRAKVRERLQRLAKDLVEIRIEKEAIAALCKQSEVSIPSILIDHDVRHQVDHFVEHLKNDGLTLERYMELTNTDFAGIENSFRKRASWELKKYFVLHEYAVKNNISVSEGDLNYELNRIAERSGKDIDEVKKILERNDKINDLHDQKMQQKLIDDLVQKVKMKEVEDPLNFDQWNTLEDPEEEMVE